MARNHGPLHDLGRWAARDTDTGWARRAATRWAAAQPALAGYRTVGEIIRAGVGDPDKEVTILAALLSQPDSDGMARQAALAVLLPRLRRCLNRALVAGTAPDLIDELEADLVVEAVAALSWPDP